MLENDEMIDLTDPKFASALLQTSSRKPKSAKSSKLPPTIMEDEKGMLHISETPIANGIFTIFFF